MSDYIATLEKQNEELKQKLAEKQDHMPKWVEHDQSQDPNIVAYAYILENCVFGYIHQTSFDSHSGYYGKTKKRVIGGLGDIGCLSGTSEETIEMLKRIIEQEYLDTFLVVFKDN